MGQTKTRTEKDDVQVIAAEVFVLKDATGQERGEFSLKEGVPSLSLMDPNGVCRIRFGMRPDDGSPQILLFDEEGRERGLLRVASTGESRLEVKYAPIDPAEPASRAPTLAEGDQVRPTGPIENAKPVQPLRAASQLFAQRCASCHDKDGSGSIARSELPRLPDFRVAEWQSARSDARLLASIVHGRGMDMPSFRRELTDVQVRDLMGVVRGFGSEAHRVSQTSGGDFKSQFQDLEREFEELEQRLQSLRGASTRR